MISKKGKAATAIPLKCRKNGSPILQKNSSANTCSRLIEGENESGE